MVQCARPLSGEILFPSLSILPRAYVAVCLPKIHVTKSIVIDTPIAEVYVSVREFKEWSKWEVTEANVLVTVVHFGMK
jgi:hypothetical protein